ncbi:MAG: transposase [Rhodospirillales bacterium]|nr:transposase [Rhodospirillales bacterium]
MTRPLSNDLRRRVVRAVVDGGMSRRGAAKRFGIAPSTAIKWVDAWRRTGSWRPRAQGGDRRSQRIEARADAVLALLDETPDMTLSEIAAHLESEHGLRVSQSAVWRFFQRRGITFNKNGARQRAAAR